MNLAAGVMAELTTAVYFCVDLRFADFREKTSPPVLPVIQMEPAAVYVYLQPKPFYQRAHTSVRSDSPISFFTDY